MPLFAEILFAYYSLWVEYFSVSRVRGVWPIKCRQGSKTNKSSCEFWKKLTFDWLVDNPSQDLFGQIPQYSISQDSRHKVEIPSSHLG
jgi:hypothetical protein